MSIGLHLRHIRGNSQQMFSRSRNPAVHHVQHERAITRFFPPPLAVALVSLVSATWGGIRKEPVSSSWLSRNCIPTSRICSTGAHTVLASPTEGSHME